MLPSPVPAQSHYKYLTASHHDHESLIMKMVDEEDDGENIADSDDGDEHEDVNHIKDHEDGDCNENHII